MNKKALCAVLYCYSLCCLLLVVLAGCGKVKNRELTQEEKDSLSLIFNYDTLQKKALAFAPLAGKNGGILTVPLYAEPVSFNPITAPGSVPYMYDGLVRINGVTGEPEPSLAQRWEASGDSLSWTFHIRPGVRWSDSVPFSAYDVAFTFNDVIYNDKTGPAKVLDLFIINGQRMRVEASDSMTVAVKLPERYAPFLILMSQEILPRHAYAKFVKQGKFSDSLGVTAAPQNMVGTGPFLLSSYTPYNTITFTRNPFYWRKDLEGNSLPYIESIIYVIMSDLDVALQCFKRGQIDYLAADGNDFAELRQHDTGFVIYHLGPASVSNVVVFNQNTGVNSVTGKPFVDTVKQNWFRNSKFRKALAHAIDRKRLIAECLKKRGYEQYSPLSPAAGRFYNPEVQRYPYDLACADSILKSEGFNDSNGDSILEDRHGNAVAFSLMINNGNQFRRTLAEIVCADFKKLGIHVQIQQHDARIIEKKLFNSPYDWEVALVGLSGVADPHLGMQVWHSTGTQHIWFPQQKTPSTAWEARIDTVFNEAAVTMSPAKRKALYDEWQQIAAEELPLIYTVLSERILCISKRVGNVNPSVSGGLLHNIEELYIK